MPSWADLVGKGSVAETLLVWGLLNQLVQDVLGPFLEAVQIKVNHANPLFPNTPADLADMTVRGVLDQNRAADEAADSGINADRFGRLVHLAGEPPGLETVLEMFRRGYIGWDDTGLDTASVERAIKTSRVYDYWSGPIRKNAQIPITVGEAVNAFLRGQTDETTAKAEAQASGINAERFQILFDSAGRPPSPMELVELLRRKLIPLEGTGPAELSFQQGIFEGDSKDKWWPLYAKLAEYLPPPRIISTLLRTGAIDQATAAKLFDDAGLTPEMQAAYIHSTNGEKMAGTRELAQGVVLELYQAKAVDQATATGLLNVLGYTNTQATLLLELYDLRRDITATNQAINRVGRLYTTHKITRAAAVELLAQFGVTPAHEAQLMATWDLELVSEVKLPTAAELGTALFYKAITPDEAMSEAMKLGYTPLDAYIVLSAHSRGPVGNKPAPGPAGPGVF